MNTSAEALLQLSDIVINGRGQTIPDNADWQDVLALAKKQGIRALVYDAFDNLKKSGTDIKGFPENEQIIKFYTQTVLTENSHTRYFELAKHVSEMWKRHGIKTIVFKGLAHSRYYPKPTHRELGDFDCYLIGGKGNCAYEQGNDVARKNGLKVDDGWYKHSYIIYKALTIENHRFFTSARRGGTDMALHKFIIDAIGDGSRLGRLDGTDIYTLPIEAEGLFMLYHSLTHFLVEGIRLRHIVDWACWMKANQDKLQWKEFYEFCKRFRLDGFTDVLNTIAVEYLGLELHDKTIFADSRYAARTIESVLNDDTSIYNRGKGRWYERLHVIGNAFKHSWKFRHVAHYSTIGYVWRFVYGFLLRKERKQG